MQLLTLLGSLALALASTQSEPFPHSCAGGQEGAHTGAVEMMLVNSYTASWWPHHAWALTADSGYWEGFTSTIPNVGTLLALFSPGLEEEASIEDSAFGFSIQRAANTTCRYHMYAWDAASGCVSHPLPSNYSPSLSCVGEGTWWSLDPVKSELMEAGTGNYPLLDFESAPPRTPLAHSCSITKRVDGLTFFPTTMWGASSDGSAQWMATIVNASTSPLDSDLFLPSSCINEAASNSIC
jgi:hypothetical protein